MADYVALRPPLTSAAERLAVAPEYLGESVVDDMTGEHYVAVMGSDGLTWKQLSGLEPLVQTISLGVSVWNASLDRFEARNV